MKYFSLFILILFLFSCGGAKKASEAKTNNQSKENIEMVNITISPKSDNDNIVPKIPKKEKELALPSKDIEPDKGSLSNTSENNTSYKTDRIHESFSNLLNDNVSQDGAVNYKGFKKDISLLRGYIASLGSSAPQAYWKSEEKLAYWINAYNAMTIDLILRHYPLKSIKEINKPWDQRLWKFGEKWLNLNDIEHQIIRKMGEPRIHFALVCAAVSCPKLYNKAFTASNLEEDLSKLTREFLADKSKNSISENDIKLSKIFSWFAKDFQQYDSLIDFLNKYTDVEISDNAKKRFNDYNWDLNE